MKQEIKGFIWHYSEKRIVLDFNSGIIFDLDKDIPCKECLVRPCCVKQNNDGRFETNMCEILVRYLHNYYRDYSLGFMLKKGMTM